MTRPEKSCASSCVSVSVSDSVSLSDSNSVSDSVSSSVSSYVSSAENPALVSKSSSVEDSAVPSSGLLSELYSVLSVSLSDVSCVVSS